MGTFNFGEDHFSIGKGEIPLNCNYLFEYLTYEGRVVSCNDGIDICLFDVPAEEGKVLLLMPKVFGEVA